MKKQTKWQAAWAPNQSDIVSQILAAMTESEQNRLRKLSLLYNTCWIGGWLGLVLTGVSAGKWGWQPCLLWCLFYLSGLLLMQRKLVESLAQTNWSASQGLQSEDIHKGLITNGFRGQRNR